MSIKITAIHLEDGQGHEHISKLRWINPADGNTGTSSRETIVAWIENQNGKAYVEDQHGNRVDVGVVTPARGSKYLRTYADKTWTDNLLALPRF